MTLDEAIKHAEDVAAKCFVERSARNHSGKCGFEHLELAAWLRELKAYKEQDHCENTDPKNRIARERYEDLVGYFGGDETILESREEFQKWLGRIKWHIKKCDELAREKEPEPCEDAISRKKVMDIIYRECSGENLNIDFAKIILLQRKIKALPSVTPKQKTGEWIELKDHKPEEFEDVLVKDIDGDVTCAYLCNDGLFLERFSGEIIDDVIEWMEIPQ
jgi:hypothetical protein